MNDPDPTTSDHEDSPASHEDHAAVTRELPAFSVRRFMRELLIDAAMRWALLVLAIGAMGVLAMGRTGGMAVSFAVAVVAIGVWVFISSRNAGVTRALPEVTALIDADPAVAEGALAELLERKPLLRWVRLMLYHRVAVLRHRQGRSDEVAAICQAVLTQPMGPAEHARPHLLLMLAESHIEAGNAMGAWATLMALYGTRLNLIEALQRLALQTRYEVMIGRHDAALWALPQKVQMAELMPAPQCATMHALLAVAATGARREQAADWLWRRAELLCEPEQFSHFRELAQAVTAAAAPQRPAAPA